MSELELFGEELVDFIEKTDLQKKVKEILLNGGNIGSAYGIITMSS